ncbi:hypothetical protein GCM10009422_18080 [Brevundimonas kwangchunensis]|uniref:Teneurin-like YD-shell domain-containing protein n=1 Tax=Brevundimonas kwangchunensis TaxID=322163 RepID=A0ABP3S458_9CAUL
MTRASMKPLLFAATSSVALIAAESVQAQVRTQPLPPEHYTLDVNGVDLVTGAWTTVAEEVVIGDPAAGGLRHGRVNSGGNWRDLSLGNISIAGSRFTVALGAEADVFTRSGSNFIPQNQEGQRLEVVSGGYKYTTRTGSVAWFTTEHASAMSFYDTSALLTRVDEPNGAQTRYRYNAYTICTGYDPYSSECLGYSDVVRLEQVENTFGYSLAYYYKSTDPEWQTNQFLTVDRVMGFNAAIDYCQPYCYNGGPSRNWPSVTYSDWLGQVATDQSGRSTTYVWGPTGIEGVHYPGQSSNDVSLTRTGPGGRVTSLTGPNGAWTYSYSDAGVIRTTTAYGPAGQRLTVVSNLSIGRATSVTNALGQTTSYLYDDQRRVTRITNPEGDYVGYVYDSRGNVTQTTHTPKAGSGLTPVVTRASYASACTNVVICNLPLTETDARGQVTDYTWDAGHGGLLSVTEPSPVSGGARPQVRITYAPRQAWYKQGWPITLSPGPSIQMPVEVSECTTGSSCSGGSNEVRTTLAYGSAGVANNLLPTTVSRGSGSSPVMASTSMSYTPNGDVDYVDGPLPGSADTTRMIHDAARQVIGVIGPDPDGGGAGQHRAQRLTYNARGQVTVTETGATAGYSDSNFASFAPVLRSETGYDAYGRPVSARQQTAGGMTYRASQLSYDAAGRVDCTVVRMNAATFGSLPASACTPATPGADGPDRITQTTYDAASRPLTRTTAVGQIEAVTEGVTYTANGQVATMTDGNGNVSVQEYDGHDRPVRLRYPNASGGGTSTTDYSEVGYDPAGNVVTSRNRAGQVTTITYDNLNRPTLVDAPSGTMDVATTYDNLGRVLTTSGNGQTLTRTWDALSDMTSEAGPLGTMSYQYDPAGRMTRITWPDSFHVQYDRDAYGAVTAIRENSATSGPGLLAVYGYGDVGQVTGITRGNGTTTGYAYDSARLMGGIIHDMAGSTWDVTFTYDYNAAGQIIRRGATNGAYVYAPVTGGTAYPVNGRNQVTSIWSTPVTYDANQNIISGLGQTYSHDAAGRLIGTSGSAYSYDPAGRMYSASSSGTHLSYAGAQLTGEHNNAGTLLVRHIPGPGLDQPVVTYHGAGLANRMWLANDERHSVINLSDGAGNTLNVNRYDEYGVPAPGNSDRFQYTGQAIIEPGLYNYRNRAYAPQFGRFLQTDPIGYGDGLNIYGYVGGDPVNAIDPLGIALQCVTAPTDNLPCVNGGPPRQLINPRNEFLDGRGVIGGSGGNPQEPPTELDEVMVQGQKPATPRRVSQDRPRPPAGVNYCTGVPGTLPTGEDFRPACRAHDQCWTTAGADQRNCDVAFYRDMREACIYPESAVSCRGQAAIYYLGVSAMRPIFDYEQRRARRRDQNRRDAWRDE